ncbi:hypothetical protein SESBI_39371 [Sesbania bispinosa]|nr:hypothetical protein SESBI_39371 [Sesbania bispinosa]
MESDNNIVLYPLFLLRTVVEREGWQATATVSGRRGQQQWRTDGVAQRSPNDEPQRAASGEQL